MTGSAGSPQTPRQRPPLSRGTRELIIAVAALPLLLAAGVYVGGRVSDRSSDTLAPAAGIASPLVTVVASPARPLVTVTPTASSRRPSPRAGGPLVPPAGLKTTAPSPVVTVKPPAPTPMATVEPPAPTPVVTVKPPAPRPNPPTAQPPTVAAPVTPAEPPPAPTAVLGRGSRGADVRAWQEQMARRTWRITVDGIFGPESERVARQFQRNKGLRVDGLVGRQTWAASWQLPVLR